MSPGKKIYTAIDMDFTRIRFKALETLKNKSKDKKAIALAEVVEYECLTSWK